MCRILWHDTSFDTNQRKTIIELSTTEAIKIKNLLLFDINDGKMNKADLYKDFFILVELLTHKRLDSWTTEYYNSIGFGNSEGDKD